MHDLGHTRSAYRHDHLLQTPDTFVRAPLPGMDKVTAVVHIAPAAGAKFTQYTAEFEAQGSMQPSAMQRFVYVIEGEIETPGERLSSGGFAYFPEGQGATFTVLRPSCSSWSPSATSFRHGRSNGNR